ncbi:MAG: PhzF family phenazine biosynthesis protein [Pseudomonadota bacterium]
MTQSYPYHIVDVFTEQRFGGNPLAVVLDAEGLSSAQMQRIAREFNFSESTFVLPADDASTCSQRVRIFTPTKEVPFAGHPNIGTAWVLAQCGRFGDSIESVTTRFDELAGEVAIAFQRSPAGSICVELRAPQPLRVGDRVSVEAISRVLGLPEHAICTSDHEPVEASVGLPFTIVGLRDSDALQRASIDLAALGEQRDLGLNPDIYCYVRDQQTINARMFAPFDGVIEDPATGSASCAVVALLHQAMAGAPDALEWQLTQGVHMGRPSHLVARTLWDGDVVTDVYLGGSCVAFAQGELQA